MPRRKPKPEPLPDLLPCPFCGGTPKTSVTPEFWRRLKGILFSVNCMDCGALVENRVDGGYEIDKDQGTRDAIEGWNRRA